MSSISYLAPDSLKEANNAGLVSPQAVCIGGLYCLMQNFSINQGLVKNCHIIITASGC
ncbi:hypothetical protein M404DRAFT_18597 [Pisolithus tinctorius Marx 270]|uniref:Uncharacterized protein n=1 Tax=Pisolithus tinctorius Marx 270 TaxID=870435 RepID=A0A0C3KY52_PISTI|nr:hypothetical protein M404DRAFT_18597 [Pisolithus tinctorius Marx 270]